MSAELMMSRIETCLMHCIASSGGAGVGCDITFTAKGEKVINISLYFNDGKPLHFSLLSHCIEGFQPGFI
ncbi:hypothetical protein EO50_07800 [Salmonella enterica]|nr:hypothetical protein [Salmonella enterica subsp. enterica]MID20590.1 hypothetical protein [Salmonella enterica]